MDNKCLQITALNPLRRQDVDVHTVTVLAPVDHALLVAERAGTGERAADRRFRNVHVEIIHVDDGLIHVTRDGGKAWDNVTPRDLPEFARISLIEASPHKPGTAFVAANRYQRADRAPYVYRTEDYGRSWVKIVGGLPGSDFARTIREDRKKPGLLYLGTEQTVVRRAAEGAADIIATIEKESQRLRRDLAEQVFA